MTTFWVFAHNLKWPITVFCLVGLAICAYLALTSEMSKRRAKYGTVESGESRLQQMASYQTAAILGIICVVAQAIPAPNYDVRVVERRVPVVQRVEVVKWREGTQRIMVPNRYESIKNQCLNSIRSYHDSNIVESCHEQAMEASRERPRVVIRRVEVHSNYAKLFAQCNDYHISVEERRSGKSGAEIRNERLEICHRAAFQAATFK